ncbi:hypothetical protein FIBSPDRAFT_959451 [Athelia psychrophila]|uniref:Uncharacterized protein n=1 Tax=Athelia psychrophila TaxID=1759441 RepID=A0A166DEK3_9AGAM|nr:hypothetical protein FIBSPDRAFT_959451 [Fibularhizoctonia sp. CBS 109695]
MVNLKPFACILLLYATERPTALRKLPTYSIASHPQASCSPAYSAKHESKDTKGEDGQHTEEDQRRVVLYYRVYSISPHTYATGHFSFFEAPLLLFEAPGDVKRHETTPT